MRLTQRFDLESAGTDFIRIFYTQALKHRVQLLAFFFGQILSLGLQLIGNTCKLPYGFFEGIRINAGNFLAGVIDQKHELIGYDKKHLLSGQGGVRQPDPIAANHDLGLPGDPLVDSIHNESCGRVSARGPENKNKP